MEEEGDFVDTFMVNNIHFTGPSATSLIAVLGSSIINPNSFDSDGNRVNSFYLGEIQSLHPAS